MTTKTTKTILFASLIATLLVPMASFNVVEAQVEDGDYVKMLKQQEGYKNMNSADKAKFVDAIKKQMNSSPYDKAISKLLEKLSKITLKIQDAEEKGKDTEQLKKEQIAVVYDLEAYGVVSEDRLLENKDYWSKRAFEAKQQTEKGEQVSVELKGSEEAGIYQIHTDDVSLKNQSQVDYPCFPWPLVLYCPAIDVEWGGGSDSHASVTQPYDGTTYMDGKICLEENGGHAQVNFTFDTEHYVKTVTGSTAFSDTNGPASVSLTTEGWCRIYAESYSGISAVAGSTSHTETHLATTVTVTG